MQKSENKKNFRLGVFYTLLGLVVLAPLFYRSIDSYQNRNVVGPFFGICLGLTFLIAGIGRISKSRKVHEGYIEPSVTTLQDNRSEQYINQSTDNDMLLHRKIPLFIKLVAFSPALPLSIAIIIGLGCKYLSFGSFLSCHGGSYFIDGVGYLGALGWLVSLPIAGMLSMIYSAFTSD